VLRELLSRHLGDWLSRSYYQLFVAEVHKHMAGQEYFLFSWRLIACDLVSTCPGRPHSCLLPVSPAQVLIVYLFWLSSYALLIGSDLTTNVVVNALLRYVRSAKHGRCLSELISCLPLCASAVSPSTLLGVVINVCFTSPFTGIWLALSSRSITFKLHLLINRIDQDFIDYYNKGRLTLLHTHYRRRLAQLLPYEQRCESKPSAVTWVGRRTAFWCRQGMMEATHYCLETKPQTLLLSATPSSVSRNKLHPSRPPPASRNRSLSPRWRTTHRWRTM
jgi:hypothetical protein